LFVGVVCDADAIALRAATAVVAGTTTCSGALWRVELQPSLVSALEACQGLEMCGLEYKFSVASGLVESCAEYLAPMTVLCAVAADHGLQLLRSDNLSAFMAERPLPALRASMRVPAMLPHAEADLVSMYRTFCLKKIK
jgi:hypothetical protein